MTIWSTCKLALSYSVIILSIKAYVSRVECSWAAACIDAGKVTPVLIEEAAPWKHLMADLISEEVPEGNLDVLSDFFPDEVVFLSN